MPQAVIDALTNSRVSINSNPCAPRVKFYADINQDGKMDVMVGDNIKATGKPVKFHIDLKADKSSEGDYTKKRL